MRLTHISALVAMTMLLAQSAIAQNSLLSQLEQGLQGPGGGQAAGAAPKGYLGAMLEDEGQMGKGVLVTKVNSGTPAEKSGLKDGDLITMVDGKPVPNLDAYDAIAKRPPGATMMMTIIRDGKTQPLAVTLGTRPDLTTGESTPGAPTLSPPAGAPPGPAPSLLPATGAGSPATLPPPGPADSSPRTPGIIATPQSAMPQSPSPPASEFPSGSAAPSGSGGASLGVTLPRPEASRARTQRGALIEVVKPGSPADIAGLKAGQIIVQIDGRPIDTDDDLIAAIKARQPGQSVELTYRDGTETRKATVRLAQAGAPATSGGPGFRVPGPAAAPAENPRVGGGSGRPLLDRIERIADNVNPRPFSTVYDPQAFSALQDRVTALESRLRAIEAKMGVTSPAPGIGSTTPGFGPSNPTTTPGFGPAGGVAPNP